MLERLVVYLDSLSSITPEQSLMPVAGAVIISLVALIVGTLRLTWANRQVNRLVGSFAPDSIDDAAFGSDSFLGHLVFHYKLAAGEQNELPDTSSLVAVHVSRIGLREERIANWAANSCVGFGLFGTFLGLINSINKIGFILAQDGARNFLDDPSKLKAPLEGMSVAFYSSVAGLFSSLVLSALISSIFNLSGKREYLMDRLEDFLNNRVFPFVHVNPVQTMVSEFGDRIRDNFDHSLASLTLEMTSMSERIVDTLRGLDQLVNQLRTASESFDQGSSRLLEFNQGLKESLGHVNHVADRTVDANDRLVATVSKLEGQVGELNNLEAKHIDQLQDMFDRSAVHMETMWSEGLSRFEKIVEDNNRAGTRLAQELDRWRATADELFASTRDLGIAIARLPRDAEESLQRILTAEQAAISELMAVERAATGRISEEVTERLSRLVTSLDETTRSTVLEMQRQLEGFAAQQQSRAENLLEKQSQMTDRQSKALESFAGAGEVLSETSAVVRDVADRAEAAFAAINAEIGAVFGGLVGTVEGLQSGQKVISTSLGDLQRGSGSVVQSAKLLQTAVEGLSEEFSRAAASSFNRALDSFMRKLDLFEQLQQTYREAYVEGIEEIKAAYAQDARMALEIHFGDLQALTQAFENVHSDFQRLIGHVDTTTQVMARNMRALAEAAATAESVEDLGGQQTKGGAD